MRISAANLLKKMTVLFGLSNRRLWPILGFLVVFSVFLGPALFTSRVLLPGDMLLNWVPWHGDRPVEVHNPMMNDVLQQVYPYQAFLRAELSEGRLPLWNPFSLNGTSFVGTSVSALFSPLNWLLLPVPQNLSYEFGALLKLLLAATGIFYFCRRIGLSVESGFAAGLIYAFSGYNTSLLIYANTNISVLFGFGLLALEDCLETKRWRSFAGFALIIAASFLGGHVESAVLHTLAYGLYALVRSWKLLIRVGMATLLGFGLSAVVTFPFAEFMLFSSTFSQRSSFERNPYFVSAESWPALLNPFFHGSPVGWQGPMPIQVLEGFIYMGIIPLLFAAVGLFSRRITTRKWPVVALFAWGIVILFGIWPFFDFFTAVPLLRQGSHFHITQIVQASGAILAGIGISAVADRGLRSRVIWVVAGLASTLFLWSLFWKVGLPVHKAQEGFFFFYRNFTLPLYSIIGLISLVFLLGFLGCRFMPRLVVTLVIMQGLLFGMFLNPAVNPGETVELVPPVAKFLQARTHDRVAGIGTGTLLPNWGMVWRVRDVRGYESLVAPRIPELYSQLTGSKFDSNQWIETLDESRLRLLARMGCKWILSPESLSLSLPGLTPTFGHFPFLYEVEGPGRLFLTRQVSRVGSPEEALERLLDESDPRVVFLEVDPDTVEFDLAEELYPSGGVEGEVSWIMDLPDNVSLQVSQPSESWLILRDTFFPGWTCRIDGRPVQINRADYLFRAVSVPAGEHHVDFTYNPVSFQAGAAVSLASLLILVFIPAVGWRRLRKARDKRLVNAGL
jgi:Bacterial membrane protein YfhO